MRATSKFGACLHPSFHASYEPVNTLDLEQSNAVGRILRSGDFVTLFRGAAGTGKSFALQEVLRGLKAADHEVQVIAPQRQQVLDLNASGIGPASTVTEFLNRKSVSPGAVVILDEAGQLGAEQMRELLRLLKQSGGRLICSGDTRQHGAVESSDALRALEKYAALKSIELKTIRRQDPARAKTTKERVAIQEYRKAVQEASEGLASESFQRLEQLGAVIECGFGEQQTVLAEQYVSLVATKESALIVAQTWSEIGKLNEHIRDALKLKGVIGSSEKKVAVLEAVDLTDAQKRDVRYYEPVAVLVFNRDIAGIRKHEKGKLLAVNEGAVVVQTAGRIRQIPFAELGRFRVCRERNLGVSVGDRLQLKANATTTDGRPLTNGELVTVAKVRPCGGVELADGRVLGAAYRQFGHGYAVTSYASQGKTVDHVLFSDAAVKAATSQEQWYVTISRGRKSVRIFTEDKEQLRENVARAGHRELALDLNGVPSPVASIRRKPQTSTQRLIEAVRRRVSWAAIKARVAGITKTVGQNV